MDVVRDEPAKHHEGRQRKDDVEKVVCRHGVQLIEQEVAGFAQQRKRH